MGLVNSYLKKNKEKRIKDIDTLNESIKNLNIFRDKLEREMENLGKKKDELIYDINSKICCSTNLENKIHGYKQNLGNLECSICMSRNKDCIMIPCGHTFCSICSYNFYDCPMCRLKIEKKIKIFY